MTRPTAATTIIRATDARLKHMVQTGHAYSREALDEIRRRYEARNEQLLIKAVEGVLPEVKRRIAELASMEIALELSKGLSEDGTLRD